MKLKYNFYAQSLIGFLQKNSLHNNEIFSAVGLPVGAKNTLEIELSTEHIHRLTMFVKNRLGIEHCGLKVSEYLEFQNTGFLGLCALSCQTLKDAVFRIYRVHKEINQLFTYKMLPPGNPTEFIYELDKYWEIKYPESAREIIEFVVANGVLTSRKLTRREITPQQITFKHEKPVDLCLYERIFKCPVYFGKEANSAKYLPGVLNFEIPTYNPTLQKILDEYSARAIEKVSNEKKICFRS